MSEVGENPPLTAPSQAPPATDLPAVVEVTPLPTAQPEKPPIDPESPPWGLTTKAIMASAVLILAALVVWRFQFLISPLVLAAVIAYLLNPLISWVRRKTEITRAQAVLIVYGLLLVLFGVGSFFLGVIVAQQSVRLWESLPEFLPRLIETAQERAQAYEDVRWIIGPYVVEPGSLLELIDWDSIAADLATSLRTIAGRSGLWLAGVATATIGTLGDTFFVLIVSIYLAMDGPRIGHSISELAHQPGYRRDAERLINDSIKIWDAYLRGQVILGIVIFVVVAVSLGVLGVNNALELGILSGILEFLPVIGPFIGTAAAVIVALLQDSVPWGLSPWIFALIVLVVMIIIQQIENAVLVPRIVGDALDLHALVVMIGVLMGTSLAGLLGAVLAAPVIATLKLFGTYVWRKMLDLPPFPDDAPDESATTGNKDSHGVMAILTEWFGSRASRT
jgi:predicted PurR-regulated permease PerM